MRKALSAPAVTSSLLTSLTHCDDIREIVGLCTCLAEVVLSDCPSRGVVSQQMEMVVRKLVGTKGEKYWPQRISTLALFAHPSLNLRPAQLGLFRILNIFFNPSPSSRLWREDDDGAVFQVLQTPNVIKLLLRLTASSAMKWTTGDVTRMPEHNDADAWALWCVCHQLSSSPGLLLCVIVCYLSFSCVFHTILLLMYVC